MRTPWASSSHSKKKTKKLAFIIFVEKKKKNSIKRKDSTNQITIDAIDVREKERIRET